MQRIAATCACVLCFGAAIPGLVPVVAAQSSQTDSQPVQAMASGLPLPSIGLPLPSIGLPLPATGLPPIATTANTAPPAAGQNADPASPGHHTGRRNFAGPGMYPFPVYLPAGVGTAAPGTLAGAGTSVGAAKASPSGAADAAGRLMLDVTPKSAAQVYVDGYYVGTPEDYPEGLELPAGPHALEVRGAGAVPATASVQVPAGRAITYRTTLESRGAERASPPVDDRPTTSPAPAATPTVFYLIPGCYLGNVLPDERSIPEGCSLDDLRIVRP